jgi:hypothetical protein
MRVIQLRPVVVALIFMVSARSLGAECVPFPKNLKKATARSTLVFSGTVTESDDVAIVSFNIDRVWKGALKQHTKLVPVGGLEELHASFFELGKAYVVFASVTELTTQPDITVVAISYCSPTSLVSSLGKRIKQLGPAKLPIK